MTKRMTNKELQSACGRLNKRFFDGRISDDLIVTFENIKPEGVFFPGRIKINKDLKRHPDYAILTLLHEMIHADLDKEGYIGHEHDEGHHMRFYAALDKLYKQGAFEGLL